MEKKAELGCRGPPDRLLLKGCLAAVPGDLPQLQGLTGMTYADGRPQDYRDLELFRQIQGQPGHLPGLFRVTRIQDRDLGKTGHQTGILLGLRGVGAWIVARDDHKTAYGAHIGRAHEGVRGHVEADLFHAAGGPLA